MRCNILHEGADQLTYEIRRIVAVANRLSEMGIEITWENIGDPVHKGEPLPAWIKEIIGDLVSQDRTYGYVPTEGVAQTRKFLAQQVNQRGGCQITPGDILFFNGLGDALTKIMGFLNPQARVICPSPSYPTHGSAEAMHAGQKAITFALDPDNHWRPDLDELERKVKTNRAIAGICLINPDNPTGSVYSQSSLETIIDIAKKYDLFVVCDEIYTHIVYNGAKSLRLSNLIGDLPGLALRGISKEYPWPGSRCGWIEIFNQDKHPLFGQYIKSMLNLKMMEVCSTSLPQYSIPRVMGDPRYKDHLNRRKAMFEERANEAYEIFSQINGIVVNRLQGAFYMPVLFEKGILTDQQTLPVHNSKARNYIEDIVRGVAPDKRFVYYLLGAAGICVVPLTGFCYARHGFRITLLEWDDEKRRRTWKTISHCIQDYLNS